MGQIVRTRHEAAKRCPDSGTPVYPPHYSKKPDHAWCGCCGRVVKIERRDTEYAKQVPFYAEHRLGSGGTIRGADGRARPGPKPGERKAR
jgi:hypothetical protein